MKRTKHDLILASLEKGDCIPPKEKSIVELRELEKKGIVKRCAENSYSLTTYGEMIKVMGYDTYKAAEEFETKVPIYSSKKMKIFNAILLAKLFVLVSILLLILFFDFGEIIIDYVWDRL